MTANDNIAAPAPAVSDPNVESWSGKDRGDENFPVGSWLIRKGLREHVHAYYAFARNADDISDSSSLSPEQKIARLNAMEEVLTGARAEGSPSAANCASPFPGPACGRSMRASCWWPSARMR